MENKKIIKYCIWTALYLIVLFHLLSCKPTVYNPDTDPEVLDWYIDNNDTIIYTRQDSIRHERERWEYIRSLEHDSLWE
jgi:hypothetical protein|tara:strand:- start:257 stop:493 length:237 start_codon:yes stop_codon:yes gene_type:complete